MAHELTHVIQQRDYGNLVSATGPRMDDVVDVAQRHSDAGPEGRTLIKHGLNQGFPLLQRQAIGCNPDHNEGFPLIYDRGRPRPARDAVGYAQRKLNKFLLDYDQARENAELQSPAAAAFMDQQRARLRPPQNPENPGDGLDVDCKFGENTTAATKIFQAAVFPLSSPFRAAGPSDSSWDGKIGDKTWPVLESGASPRPAKLTLVSASFDTDHRLLVNNTQDWGPVGAIAAPFGVPQVTFVPVGDLALGSAVPMSISAGRTLEGTAVLQVENMRPGIDIGIDAAGAAPWLSLAGEFRVSGATLESVPIKAEAPFPGKVHSLLGQELLWQRRALGKERTIGVSFGHDIFVTAGVPHDPFKIEARVPAGPPNFNVPLAPQFPNVPTIRRLGRATEVARGLGVNDADKITLAVLDRYPSYGPETAPELWELSEREGGPFQCVVIALYAEAFLNVLGVPSTQTVSVGSVVISARTGNFQGCLDPKPGNSAQGCLEPAGGGGVMGDPAFQKGNSFLTLLDFGGGPNNFEGCVELKWLVPREAGQPVLQYYCGGVRNPRAGFRDATHVVTTAFVELAYVRRLPSGRVIITERKALYNPEPASPSPPFGP